MRLSWINIPENRLFVGSNLSATYENTDLIDINIFSMVSQDSNGCAMVYIARV